MGIDDGWFSGEVVCNICGRKWVAVYPPSAEFYGLECPDCGSMSGQSDDD